MASPSTVRAPRPRLDWHAIKDQVSIEAVARALLGDPPGRLAWLCPWHDDHHPSLKVNPGRGRWDCWPCGIGGDAADLVMRIEGLTFPEAVRRAAEICGVSPTSGDFRDVPSRPKPAASPGRPKAGPSGLPATDASALVEDAAKAIWTPEGSKALSYLHGRGLSDETIRAARLGWIRRATVPKRDGGSFDVSGICIPWSHLGRLATVKVRLLPPWKREDGKETKYVGVFGDSPIAFPSIEAVKPGRPLVAVEGEFDALLLHQEIGDMACVVTLGSASSPAGPEVLRAVRSASAVFAAHDADAAGDTAPSKWPARSVRVKPPGGAKDWTAAFEAGADLRAHWLGLLKPSEGHEVEHHVDHEAATFDPTFGPLDDWDRAMLATLDREGFRLVVREDRPRDVQTTAKTTPTVIEPEPDADHAEWVAERLAVAAEAGIDRDPASVRPFGDWLMELNALLGRSNPPELAV